MSVVEPTRPTTTTVIPSRSTYYSPSEIQQWQSIHGSGSYPPGYLPSQPPAPKPTTQPIPQTYQQPLKVSENVLQASDTLRRSEGEKPLEETTPLEVYSYKSVTEPVIKVSESTLEKSDMLRKKEGEKPLEKTTSLEVTSYKTNKEVTASKTTYEQPDILKKTAGYFLAGAAGIGLRLASAIPYVTGKEFLGLKPNETDESINARVAKTFGSKSVDPIGTLAGKESVVEKTAAVVGAGAFLGIGIFGGGRAVRETVPAKPSTVATKIITGVKETEEIKPISETTTVNKVTKFEQVSIPKTETNVNPEIKTLQPQVERVQTPFGEKVRAEVPKPPPSGKTATLTQKEALGEAKIPLTTISKTATSYYRSPLSNLELQALRTTEKTQMGLEENPLEGKIIIQNPTTEQRATLNLKPVKGVKETYTGKLTEQSASALDRMVEQHKLEEVGAILRTYTKEAGQTPRETAFGIKEPGFFKEAPGITRPETTRVFQGPQRYIKLTEPKEEPEPGKGLGDIFSKDTAEPKGTLKEQALFTKPTQEEVQNQYPLMTVEQKAEIMRGLSEKLAASEQAQATEPRATYTGLTASSKGVLISEETTFLKVPPETRTKLNVGTSTETILQTKTVPGTKELESNISGLISKSKEESRQESDTVLSSMTGLKGLTSQVTRTDQQTKQVTKLVEKQTEETETPTPSRSRSGFGLLPTPGIDEKKYKKMLRGKSKEKQNFIGNVPAGEIVGVYKREDITYGKKVSRLASKDISRTEKGSPRLVKEKHAELLKKSPNTFTKGKERKIRL